MCLVEIEGIPKLQTGCSTPVKDGMVVHTQTDRVKDAQHAVVEFLLDQPPARLPGLRQGRRVPAAGHHLRLGRAARSRFIEPKRHFEKPLALSPLIAIDRERCILCYRCVRFCQEVTEDYQLVLLERGAHTFVGTFDGHPYVAPFSGNIIELCPVGALTSQRLPLPRAPVGHRGRRHRSARCARRSATSTFTVRDERVLRVLARDHDEVDDGWLCDQGRFAYQAIHVDERITAPLVRDGGELRPVAWERALDEAAAALGAREGQAPPRSPAAATTNEEGFLLQRLLREALGSADLDSRAGGDAAAASAAARSRRPRCRRPSPTSSSPTRCSCSTAEPVDDAPILDLRIRKGVRRHGVQLAVATARPSALDPNAKAVAALRARRRRGVRWPRSTQRSRGGDVDAAADAAGATPTQVRALAACLRDAGEDVVIVWGERLAHGPRGGERGARAARTSPARLGARRAATAPGCSRSRRRRTAAACARPACCRTPGPGSPSADRHGPRRAPRSPARSPTAS